jgi:hypothetical protein
VSEDNQLTPEDQALLRALAALAPPGEAAPPGDAAETETLTRLYLETLGLMPFALPPVPPRPELARRLMTQIAAAPASGATATVLAPPSTGATAAPGATLARSPEPARFAHPARPASPAKWPLALAAALILALLGTCGWLIRDLREREAVVARLAGQRNAALRQAGEVEARLALMRSRVASLRDSMGVVTSPAVEVCNLRAATPEMGNAHGVLFVAADHQHWTLSWRGLRPPGSGKVYQLWFVADRGMVSGGTFDARPGAPNELGSAHMPAGTKGVKITLEDSPGAPLPSGPDVLRNADTLHAL